MGDVLDRARTQSGYIEGLRQHLGTGTRAAIEFSEIGRHRDRDVVVRNARFDQRRAFDG